MTIYRVEKDCLESQNNLKPGHPEFISGSDI